MNEKRRFIKTVFLFAKNRGLTSKCKDDTISIR